MDSLEKEAFSQHKHIQNMAFMEAKLHSANV